MREEKKSEGTQQGQSRKGSPARGLASGRSCPLHPFLFAMASVLALMANSLNQVTFFHIAPALGGVLLFATLIYLGIAFLRRRFDACTSVIASIWIVGCLFYFDLFGPIEEQLGGDFSLVRSLPLAFAAMALLTLLVPRSPPGWIRLTNLLLNAIAAILFLSPTWEAAAWEWRKGAGRLAYDADRAAATLPQPGTGNQVAPTGRPPDIYHFVFDRFPSQEILAEHYGLDISETLLFLESRGFHLARESHSNYHRTAHSLASTFYMDYLDLLAEDPALTGDNWQPLHRMLGDHRVARFLQARGYDFIQFGSWWTGTFHNPVAQENRPHGFSEFDMLYLRRTLLRPLFHLLPDWPLTLRLAWDNGQCQRVEPQLAEIKALRERGETTRPVYVFAHFLLPHGPYNFTSDGRCLSRQQSEERGSKQGFIDQTLYASRIIKELVMHLLDQEGNPPVILIHADEGPFPEEREVGVPWQDLPDEQLRIKTAILNAYFLPEGNYQELNAKTSPVNSFRILFNALFGTDFDILPDRTYVTPDDRHLYEFHDITARLERLPELAAEE